MADLIAKCQCFESK